MLIFFVMLLVINIALTSTLQTQATRVRIPYSPTFLDQVNAGNVSSISSKGTTVQGNFRTEVRYPNSTAAPSPMNPRRAGIVAPCRPERTRASPPASRTAALTSMKSVRVSVMGVCS